MRELDKDFTPPERRFDKRALAKLLEMPTKVDCECPNHLASLVTSLLAFEDYARSCQDKNEADAKIHSLLYRETSAARGRLEDALVKLCEFEGLDLEAAARDETG